MLVCRAFSRFTHWWMVKWRNAGRATSDARPASTLMYAWLAFRTLSSPQIRECVNTQNFLPRSKATRSTWEKHWTFHSSLVLNSSEAKAGCSKFSSLLPTLNHTPLLSIFFIQLHSGMQVSSSRLWSINSNSCLIQTLYRWLYQVWSVGSVHPLQMSTRRL